MSVMASIIEAPDGTTPVASFARSATPKAIIAAMLDATSAISIRRNSSSPASHVVNTNVDEADRPAERDQGVAAQGDHRLRRRQRRM